MKKIGFIGVGNMGGALARAAAKCDGIKILVSDLDARKAAAIADEIGAEVATAEKIAAECKMVFLGVKPAGIADTLGEIASELRESGAVVVSMAAGVSTEIIESTLRFDAPVLRIMPNMPVSVGSGMILLARGRAARDEDVVLLRRVLLAAGMIDELPERLIDAGTAVSGCGPAFVYMFIEAMADGGVKCGLTREAAIRYATETLIGAASVVRVTAKHPEELKDAVCSPGGSTIEGVHALEAGAFRATVIDAVVSAYERTRELGK